MTLSRNMLLLITAGISALLLILWVFGHALTALLTEFVVGPAFLGGVAILFALAVVWLTMISRKPPFDTRPVFGIAMAAATFAVMLCVPIFDIQSRADFRRHLAARNDVVSRIETGKLGGKATGEGEYTVGLDAKEGQLSDGGNEVFVTKTSGRTYVLFFYERGILDSYSGFVYVPDGGSIEEFGRFEAANDPRPLSNHWYRVSGD